MTYTQLKWALAVPLALAFPLGYSVSWVQDEPLPEPIHPIYESAHFSNPYSEEAFWNEERATFFETGCVNGGFHPNDCPPHIDPWQWNDHYQSPSPSRS